MMSGEISAIGTINGLSATCAASQGRPRALATVTSTSPTRHSAMTTVQMVEVPPLLRQHRAARHQVRGRPHRQAAEHRLLEVVAVSRPRRTAHRPRPVRTAGRRRAGRCSRRGRTCRASTSRPRRSATSRPRPARASPSRRRRAPGRPSTSRAGPARPGGRPTPPTEVLASATIGSSRDGRTTTGPLGRWSDPCELTPASSTAAEGRSGTRGRRAAFLARRRSPRWAPPRRRAGRRAGRGAGSASGSGSGSASGSACAVGVWVGVAVLVGAGLIGWPTLDGGGKSLTGRFFIAVSM